MAYQKIKWVDRKVEREKTYTSVTNTDGSITLTESPGEVYAKGTPQSATNFNNSEQYLLHLSVAYDELMCVCSSLVMEVKTLQEQVAALSST